MTNVFSQDRVLCVQMSKNTISMNNNTANNNNNGNSFVVANI